jgi:hypothetical protein
MEKIPFGKFGFINRDIIDWIQEHLALIASSAVVILGATIWMSYQWHSGSPKDYLIAETIFNQWSGARNEQLIKLQKILKQHPELHVKYDGPIAQKLLLCSEQGLATSFSKTTLKRVERLSPYYAQFSQCSLLIGGKNFQEALAHSKTLKQALDQDVEFWKTKSEIVKHGQMLYGYNLLRIAFLEQALSNTQGEIEAWHEFKEHAGWIASSKQCDPHAYELICQNFQKNDVSLKDFVEYRESTLTSSEAH